MRGLRLCRSLGDKEWVHFQAIWLVQSASVRSSTPTLQFKIGSSVPAMVQLSANLIDCRDIRNIK